MMNRRIVGGQYEAHALAYLKKHGLTLVAQNWQCRFGELDLVMQEGSTLVFVEVKQRKSASFGGAEASITASKMSKLKAAATLYMSVSRYRGACRIDAVLIRGEDALAEVEWLKNIGI